MCFSTNDVYKCTQQIIKEEIIIEDKNNPLSYFSNGGGPATAAYSTFEFKRRDVWHNFKTGQFTIIFSENIFDENDNLIHQFKDITEVIYIERQNSEWVVTNIKHII